jgi:WD40 repeat protein
MIPSEFRANQKQSVKETMCEQRESLHYRFDDLAVYLKYLNVKGLDRKSALASADSVDALRSNLLSLQHVPPLASETVLTLAPAAFARKKRGGQHACLEHSNLRKVTMSPNGEIFATYGLKGHVAVWEASTGKLMHELVGHSGTVNALSFCHHGNLVSTGSDDTTVRLWNAFSGKSLYVLEGHSSPVMTVSWNLGAMLVSRSQDGAVNWWDSQTGYKLRFSGSEVLTGLWRKTDFLHSTVNASSLRISAWSVHGMVVSWSSPVKDAFKESEEFSVSVVDGLSCRPVPVVLDPAGTVVCVASTMWHQDVEFHYCAVGCSDNTIRLFYKHCHQNIGQGVRLAGHKAEICALAWSPDENFLASCSADCTVRLWGKSSELVSGMKFVRVLQGHDGRVTCVAWSPDGCKVVTGAADGTARLWNVSTGVQERVLQDDTGPVTSVAFAGREVFAASEDGALRIHRVNLGMF